MTFALFNLINFGRSKYHNLMSIGPANCSKAFLINSLQKSYNCFQNPGCSSFAWTGTEEAELINTNWFSMVVLITCLRGMIIVIRHFYLSRTFINQKIGIIMKYWIGLHREESGYIVLIFIFGYKNWYFSWNQWQEIVIWAKKYFQEIFDISSRQHYYRPKFCDSSVIVKGLNLQTMYWFILS